MHALKVITVTLYFLLLVQSKASRREPSARLFIWCAYVVVRPAVAAMQWLQYTRYFIHVVMPVASSLAFEREQGKGHWGTRASGHSTRIQASRALAPSPQRGSLALARSSRDRISRRVSSTYDENTKTVSSLRKIQKVRNCTFRCVCEAFRTCGTTNG